MSTPGIVTRDAAAPADSSLQREATLARRGVVLGGRFEPSAESMLVSPAPLFQCPTRVCARFSNASISASRPCTDAPPDVLELRMRFLGHAGDREVRAHDRYAFEATFQEPDPRPSISYATACYLGSDTYARKQVRGEQLHMRFHFAPVAGEHRFKAIAATGLSPDYLEREMRQRIDGMPVLFTWFAQIAQDGDNPGDVIWSRSEHAYVRLGTVLFEHMLEGDWPDAGYLGPPADFAFVDTHSGRSPASRISPNTGEPL